MRKKWFAFGCLTSIVLLIVLFYFVGASLGRMAKTTTKKIDPNTYLHVKLSGSMKEYNELKDDYFMKQFSDTSLSVHELVQKINFATHDPNVRGIILEPFYFSTGFANMNEIRKVISKFRQSGKPVYTYLEMVGNSDYFVCSNTDRIFMNPSASAMMMLTGIGSETLFFKEMLDKMGVDMKVIHAGQYKGAGENFSRTNFSPPVRKNLERLFDDIYQKMLMTIAESRNISYDEVKHIYENRKEIIINQETALQYKLVDELLFKDEMLSKLNIHKNQLLDVNNYKTKEQSVLSNNQIAVVYAQGNIMKGSSTDPEKITAAKFVKVLDNVQKNSKVKAVVMRINSPGGSALESEIILHKIKQLREEKPVIISMGNVAASGGYYLACNSDFILADDFTITGSIGVVGMFPNVKELSQKIGISTDKISRGKYSNLISFWERPTEQEIASIERMLETTYNEFKTRVSNGRNLSLAEVEEVAQGQVWSSTDALSNQLIDEVGTINDAILKASTIANMDSYTLAYFPKQKTFMEYFLEERFDMNILWKIVSKETPLALIDFEEMYTYLESVLYDPVQAISPIIGIAE